jgi:hypothetical protein
VVEFQLPPGGIILKYILIISSFKIARKLSCVHHAALAIEKLDSVKGKSIYFKSKVPHKLGLSGLLFM